MNPTIDGRTRVATAAALHAFWWLLVANVVGVLLALLLVVPRVGAMLGPLTWGRWWPLHLDLQFYGWVAIPVLGSLLVFLTAAADDGRAGARTLAWWSAALAASAVSWLQGHSSGKIFLEWQGLGRWALAAGGFALVAGGAVSWWRGWRLGEPRRRQWVRGLVLAAALPVPVLLVLATSPDLFPPINPDSGGATHSNTAASVLGVVAVVIATPWWLGMQSTDAGRRRRRVLAALVVHGILITLVGGGDHSHTEMAQQVLLASLVVWLPLSAWSQRVEPWTPTARRWLAGAAGWGSVVLITGLIAGWPGLAERWKFTNALVGHVHAALAGLVSAWLIALLIGASRSTTLEDELGGRRPALIWHGGLALQVVALIGLGTVEGAVPGLVARTGQPVVLAAYWIRLLGGVMMTLVAWQWWRSTRRAWVDCAGSTT